MPTYRLKKMTGRCVGCGKRQDFDPDAVESGDHPCCRTCLMPLVDFAVTAESSDAE